MTERLIPIKEGIIETDFSDINDNTITHSDNLLIVQYSKGRVYYDYQMRNTSFISENLHFHSPSEHHIDGFESDLEMHTVMDEDNGSGQLLALGILFDLDETAEDIPFITSLKLDRIQSDTVEHLDDVPLHEFIEEISNLPNFNYIGSVTTPP